MDWQQKADALNSLADIHINIREAGDWWVNQSTEIGGDGMLLGSFGNGATPEEAIEDHWRVLVTDLAPGRYIVVSAYRDDRKQWRWNGYMWREIPVLDRQEPE